MTNQHHTALPTGFQLENYRLDSVLGHGGFGITYRASDEDLQQVVAIKEYLPREVASRDRNSTVIPLSDSDRETFEWGLERFLDEARTLARFKHANIVGVRRFIRANGTAYLVMDYCDGESLENVLAREGTLAPGRLGAMLVPLLNALEALHAAGVTHRDIKPGNIYLRDDGSPILLDFGAARQALARHSRSITAMATAGYAAVEQYSTKGKQGPWTDIYGLGATLYRCVTGKRPADATDRMLEDDLAPIVETVFESYPLVLLAQIDAALRVRPEDRPQSVSEWCAAVDLQRRVSDYGDSQEQNAYDQELRNQNEHPDQSTAMNVGSGMTLENSTKDIDRSWKIACGIFPDLQSLSDGLLKISPKLSLSFIKKIIESRNFPERESIAELLESQFLEYHFGKNKDIKEFGKELILIKNKEAVEALSELAAVMGDNTDSTLLISQIEERFDLEQMRERRELVATLNNYISERAALELARSYGYDVLIRSPFFREDTYTVKKMDDPGGGEVLVFRFFEFVKWAREMFCR